MKELIKAFFVFCGKAIVLAVLGIAGIVFGIVAGLFAIVALPFALLVECFKRKEHEQAD